VKEEIASIFGEDDKLQKSQENLVNSCFISSDRK